VFSISQARKICQAYEAASAKTGKSPPFYVTHISGIFDEYLGKFAVRNGIAIDNAVLKSAGIAIARKQYAMMKKEGYRATLMGGGARDAHHFTDITGGDAHITINWSTVKEIIDSGISVESTIGLAAPQKAVDELREKFVDFRKAWDDDGLEEAAFNGFGPVQLFRNAFLKGWYLLLAEVANRKVARAL